jgi:hypothetical protein
VLALSVFGRDKFVPAFGSNGVGAFRCRFDVEPKADRLLANLKGRQSPITAFPD